MLTWNSWFHYIVTWSSIRTVAIYVYSVQKLKFLNTLPHLSKLSSNNLNSLVVYCKVVLFITLTILNWFSLLSLLSCSLQFWSHAYWNSKDFLAVWHYGLLNVNLFLVCYIFTCRSDLHRRWPREPNSVYFTTRKFFFTGWISVSAG